MVNKQIRLRKNNVQALFNFCFKIEIEPNLIEVDFLDATFNLMKGTFSL